MKAKDIDKALVMQLATSTRNGQPWVCTVYFVIDRGCFYWLSFPQRRHSQELENNPNAAVAIAVKADVPVIGVQAEGEVVDVSAIAEATRVLAKYVAKYGKGEKFIEHLKDASNRHKLYRLTPKRIVMFNETQKDEPSYREIKLDD